jgi:hypothetical protein
LRPTLARAPQPTTSSRPNRTPVVVARQTPGSEFDGGGGHESAAGSGSSSLGGGSDSDSVYSEVLRRVREEQEQLGQLIPHPF